MKNEPFISLIAKDLYLNVGKVVYVSKNLPTAKLEAHSNIFLCIWQRIFYFIAKKEGLFLTEYQHEDFLQDYTEQISRTGVNIAKKVGKKIAKNIFAMIKLAVKKLILMLLPIITPLLLIILVALSVYTVVFIMPKYVSQHMSEKLNSKFVAIFSWGNNGNWNFEKDKEMLKRYETVTNQYIKEVSEMQKRNGIYTMTQEQIGQAEPHKLQWGILASLDRVLGKTDNKFMPIPEKHYEALKTKYQWLHTKETYEKTWEEKVWTIIDRDEDGSPVYGWEWETNSDSWEKNRDLLLMADTYKNIINYDWKVYDIRISAYSVQITLNGKTITTYNHNSSNIPEKYKKYYDMMIDTYKTQQNSSKIRNIKYHLQVPLLDSVKHTGTPYQRLRDYLNQNKIVKESDIEFIIHMAYNLENDEYDFDSINFLDNEMAETDIYINLPTIQGNWTRADLIRTATSLLDLPYFWGGKHPQKGINPNWGKYKIVTAGGNWATGTAQLYGLDCSGFVDWAYYQMLGKTVGKGGGTVSQWLNTKPIKESELRPGDLGFYGLLGGGHVGIYIGEKNGKKMFIHAGGRAWKTGDRPAGRVVITYNNTSERYNGNAPSKFKYFRRVPVSFVGD